MFPVHRLDLHPHQRNEMQSTASHYPSFEAIPLQMRADPDRLYYQSWPCGSNYAYTYPTQFHGCCEHNHFPGYYGLRCPSYVQPPPPYYHGNYSGPPGAYPIQYIPPPPHHTMELPLYEYDKDMGGYYHCCGCPNNPCNRKGGKGVKIEEASPHIENKVDESLVPFNFRNYPYPRVWYSPSDINTKVGYRTNDLQCENQVDGSDGAKACYPYPIFWLPSNQIVDKENNKSNEPVYEKQKDDSSNAKTNYPYPILWFPPTYSSNKEDGISNEPQDEKQEGSFDGSKIREILKPSEQQRDFMNGWFPLDMKNSRPSKSRSARQQLQHHGDGFPCPVFWKPYKPEEKESKDHKGTGVDQECTQRTPSRSEVSPEMVPATQGNINSEMNDEIIDHKGPREMVKTYIQKTIPVRQAEPNEEKPLNCSEAGKSSKDAGKRKSPSPTKSSKLPPVCLRVDPLPRRKNANGSSRFPSDKGKPIEVSGEKAKPAGSLDAKGIPQVGITSKDAMQVRDKDKEQRKSKTKTIPVSEGTESQAGNGGLINSSSEGILESQTNHKPRDATDDLFATDVKCNGATEANSEGAIENKSMAFSCQTDEDEEKSKAKENPANIAKKLKRVALSEAEAARIIQSAYRGYEVRRWEPLQKLKQIMEVSKKVVELKSSIQAFESSPDIQGIEKWRTVIGETIMNLLLKLDTIQGMHPSIRDVRKSVAKELVGLQEKVDYLTLKKSETITQEASPALFGENMENKDDLCIKTGQDEEKQEHENSQSEPVNEFHQEVVCQAESYLRGHAVTNSGNLDTPEMVKDAFTNSQNRDMAMIVTDEVENSPEPTSEASSAETELENRVVFPQVGDQAINPALGGTCSLLENEVSELKVLEKLPKGELSEDTCMPDNLVQNKPGEDITPEDEAFNELPKGVLDENTNIQDKSPVKNDQGAEEVLAEGCLESEELAQLPLGVLDDDDNSVFNELPKGVLDEGTDIQDKYLVKVDQRADEVLAEMYLESKELAQLPRGVLDEDDSESKMHLPVEEEEEKGKANALTVGVNAEQADRGVPYINQLESRQEMTPKVLSEANGSLGFGDDEDNNVQLLKMVDRGSEDVGQAVEEEASVKSKAVDEPEMVHGKEQTRSNAEVSNDKSEVGGYFAAENEILAMVTTTESREVSKTYEDEVPELSFFESGNANVSGGDNGPTDSRNSSNKDASQECDLPAKLSKSCDMDHEEKQLNENFELQTTGGAACIDGTLTQACNSGALEAEPLNHREYEYDPFQAKQTGEQELPPSPSASQISLESEAFSEGDRKLIEENMRLREMMQKLIEAGQEQLTAISNLSSRVKDLEKRICKKKKLKMRRRGTSRSFSGSSCLKPSNDPQKRKTIAMAM